MNRGEAIKRLKHKMKIKCRDCNKNFNECFFKQGYCEENSDMVQEHIYKCNWMALTNLMIEELNGD